MDLQILIPTDVLPGCSSVSHGIRNSKVLRESVFQMSQCHKELGKELFSSSPGWCLWLSRVLHVLGKRLVQEPASLSMLCLHNWSFLVCLRALFQLLGLQEHISEQVLFSHGIFVVLATGLDNWQKIFLIFPLNKEIAALLLTSFLCWSQSRVSR